MKFYEPPTLDITDITNQLSPNGAPPLPPPPPPRRRRGPAGEYRRCPASSRRRRRPRPRAAAAKTTRRRCTSGSSTPRCGGRDSLDRFVLDSEMVQIMVVARFRARKFPVGALPLSILNHFNLLVIYLRIPSIYDHLFCVLNVSNLFRYCTLRSI